ncbi:MAG: SDR family NAD(P)-dependent oxidoreductase [Bauldia sp.]
MRSAVVTGVSTGIGRAVAEALIGAGYQVFGSVRRAADAVAFEAALGERAHALVFDLRDDASIDAAAATVAASTKELAALINSAGIAAPGPLEHIALKEFRDQLAVNLTGTLAVTQAFLPLLRAGQGRIVNVSSVAGRTAMPFLGAYSAAKFGLEALSDSLRRELVGSGVDVIVLQPGGIATPIWSKAADRDATIYDDTSYADPLQAFREVALGAGAAGLPAQHVGKLVLAILSARRPRVRYLLSRAPFTERMMRLVPPRLLDRIIARRLGIR